MIEYVGFTDQINNLINEKLNEVFEEGYEQGWDDRSVDIVKDFVKKVFNLDIPEDLNYEQTVEYVREVKRLFLKGVRMNNEIDRKDFTTDEFRKAMKLHERNDEE